MLFILCCVLFIFQLEIVCRYNRFCSAVYLKLKTKIKKIFPKPQIEVKNRKIHSFIWIFIFDKSSLFQIKSLYFEKYFFSRKYFLSKKYFVVIRISFHKNIFFFRREVTFWLNKYWFLFAVFLQGGFFLDG